MKYNTGIFNWFGYVMPMEERLCSIKKAGFDSTMLWWEDEYWPRDIDKSSFVKMADSCGLKVDNYHLPYESTNLLFSRESTLRNRYVTQVMQQMEGCKAAGAERVVMHIADRTDTAPDTASMLKSMETIVRQAENIGIKIAAENTHYFKQIDILLQEIDSPYLGLCYDTSHDFVQGQSKGALLTKHRSRLMCVHISDNDFVEDRHWLPGNGLIPFKSFIDTVKDSGCCMSMEVYPSEQEKSLSPEEFLQKAYAAITSL